MKFDLIAFDVNETLLDVAAMADPFEQTMGSEVSVGEWFARLLHRSLLANDLGLHRSFGELGAEVLMWMAARRGTDLDPEQAAGLVAHMTRLPPHPDVPGALASLQGNRLVTLTNGSLQAATAQAANAGLDGYFERALSVDAVERFKPDPEVYRYAARECGVEIDRMLLVAAHDWDVAGAQAAGAAGCFVRRQPWGLEGVTPDLEIDDLGGLIAVLEE